MKFLLDTNVFIAVMRGQAAAVSRLSARAPGECAVSAVTAYELFTGVAKCREPEGEHTKVLRLFSAAHCAELVLKKLKVTLFDVLGHSKK